MALDFNDLPLEQLVPDQPPSRLFWTIVFFVLVLAGVFAVLLLWPSDEPTHTPWFWTCITVFPLGIASLLVSRPFSAYEGTRLEIQSWNAACEKLAQERYAQESVPALVLASSLRVTQNDAQNGAAQIASGALTLESGASQHEDNDSISARWLEPDACLLCADDKERHRELLEWLATIRQRGNQPAPTFTSVVILSDFEAVVECSRRGACNAIIAVPGTGHAIVQARDRAAHERACRRTLRDGPVSRMAVANADNAWHSFLSFISTPLRNGHGIRCLEPRGPDKFRPEAREARRRPCD